MKSVFIEYTNWKDETSIRHIQPIALVFRSTEWHTEEQWLLEAMDLDKGEVRFFAMKDIHSWEPREAPVGSTPVKVGDALMFVRPEVKETFDRLANAHKNG
jgi:predicted DNA-binding transcriptional regulator YafY